MCQFNCTSLTSCGQNLVRCVSQVSHKKRTAQKVDVASHCHFRLWTLVLNSLKSDFFFIFTHFSYPTKVQNSRKKFCYMNLRNVALEVIAVFSVRFAVTQTALHCHGNCRLNVCLSKSSKFVLKKVCNNCPDGDSVDYNPLKLCCDKYRYWKNISENSWKML